MSATAQNIPEQSPASKLESLVPLKDLSTVGLRQIADSAKVEKLSAGATLVAADEHRSLVYLLAGKMHLARNGESLGELDSNKPLAAFPIFENKSKPLSVTTLSSCIVIRVEKNQLKVLLEKEQSEATAVSEFETDDLSDELFSRVYQAYVDRKLRLPSLPDVALKIRETVKDPDLGIADIARIVQSDPPLTARLIQVANSPVYKGISPVSSVLAAVNRLGPTTTQNLAFVMVVSDLFNSQTPYIRAKLTHIYKVSSELAALCFVIASECEHLDRERAMLLGLISNIGAVPILAFAADDEGGEMDESSLDKAITNLCSIVTGLVLSQWGFDPEIAQISEYCDATPYVRDVNKDISYSDVLMAAKLMCNSEISDRGSAEKPAFNEHPVSKQFEAAEIIESEAEFLAKMAEEIAATQALLNG